MAMTAINWEPDTVPRVYGETTAYALLGKVVDVIREEPRRYHQGLFLAHRTSTPPNDQRFRHEFLENSRHGYGLAHSHVAPACGTIGCVAGWVSVLLHGKFPPKDIQTVARKALGLTFPQAGQLFRGSAAGEGGCSQAHATRGIRHIERFRAAHKRQLQATRVRPGAQR